ncbi:MAG: mobile mystery protein A [Candidatus Marinimicrobia bacterium]|nr:mobile mystery protein A [Candidatus Neomarinimicrobiota bacterium]
MKSNRLILDQLDSKIKNCKNLSDVIAPSKGWIYSIRKALNMSLRQLGERMSITTQSVWEIENREKNGTISLNVLRQVGESLNMRLVYGFIPEDASLHKMIEKRALALATEIVQRTSVSMALENQKPSKGYIDRAIKEKAHEIREEMPKYLWD